MIRRRPDLPNANRIRRKHRKINISDKIKIKLERKPSEIGTPVDNTSPADYDPELVLCVSQSFALRCEKKSSKLMFPSTFSTNHKKNN
jgi:hypothetical protein